MRGNVAAFQVSQHAGRRFCGLSIAIKSSGLFPTVRQNTDTLSGRVNAVYAELFGDHRPARAVVPARDLHFVFQVEIEAVAAFDSTHHRDPWGLLVDA